MAQDQHEDESMSNAQTERMNELEKKSQGDHNKLVLAIQDDIKKSRRQPGGMLYMSTDFGVKALRDHFGNFNDPKEIDKFIRGDKRAKVLKMAERRKKKLAATRHIHKKENSMVQPASSITKSLPFLKRLWVPLLNLVGEKNEFRIIITAPDYVEFQAFWGLISYEEGQKAEFVVRGTESYVTSIISSLSSKGLDVHKMIR